MMSFVSLWPRKLNQVTVMETVSLISPQGQCWSCGWDGNINVHFGVRWKKYTFSSVALPNMEVSSFQKSAFWDFLCFWGLFCYWSLKMAPFYWETDWLNSSFEYNLLAQPLQFPQIKLPQDKKFPASSILLVIFALKNLPLWVQHELLLCTRPTHIQMGSYTCP